MKKLYSVPEASKPENTGKSENYLRAGIHLGFIRAEKVGNAWVLTGDEVQRIKADPPTISYEQMYGKKRNAMGKSK